MEQEYQNPFFKAIYSTEEREDCLRWFEKHMAQLPKEMEITKSVKSNDLTHTVSRLLMLSRIGSPVNSNVHNGYLSYLLLIRDKLRSLPDWKED